MHFPNVQSSRSSLKCVCALHHTVLKTCALSLQIHIYYTKWEEKSMPLKVVTSKNRACALLHLTHATLEQYFSIRACKGGGESGLHEVIP